MSRSVLCGAASKQAIRSKRTGDAPHEQTKRARVRHAMDDAGQHQRREADDALDAGVEDAEHAEAALALGELRAGIRRGG